MWYELFVSQFVSDLPIIMTTSRDHDTLPEKANPKLFQILLIVSHAEELLAKEEESKRP